MAFRERKEVNHFLISASGQRRGCVLVWSCMSGVLFQYRTYRGVDDWLLTLGPCRFFFGGGRRLSYSRKCSNGVTVSFSCLVT
ncbi:hypothetical protein Bca4012_098453 [Brassica carinata]